MDADATWKPLGPLQGTTSDLLLGLKKVPQVTSL